MQSLDHLVKSINSLGIARMRASDESLYLAGQVLRKI